MKSKLSLAALSLILVLGSLLAQGCDKSPTQPGFERNHEPMGVTSSTAALDSTTSRVAAKLAPRTTSAESVQPVPRDQRVVELAFEERDLLMRLGDETDTRRRSELESRREQVRVERQKLFSGE